MNKGENEETKPPEEEAEPQREIGFLSFVLINVGLAIGFGTMIFVPLAASLVGPLAILLIVIVLLMTLPLVLTMTEMGTIFPYTGGTSYNILYGFARKYAPFFLLLLLILTMFITPASQGGEALSFAQYFKSLIPPLSFIPGPLIAIVLILLLGYINIRGVKSFSQWQVAMVLMFLPLLIIWGLIALPHVQMSNFIGQPFIKPGTTWLTVFAALGCLYWAFAGTSYGGALAGELKYPLTVFPKGMILSVLLIFTVNVWVLIICLGLAPLNILGAAGAAPLAAASKYGGVGTVGVLLVSLAALTMHSTSINTNLAEVPRNLFAAGRQGILPGWFGKLSSEYKTPIYAIVFIVGLMMVVALPNLITIAGAGACLIMCTTNAVMIFSMIRLRMRKPKIDRPFKVPMIIPVLGLIAVGILAIGLTYFLGMDVSSTLGVSISIGMAISIIIGMLPITIGIIYYLYRRGKLPKQKSFEEIKEEMRIDDDSTIPESEWTETKAPLRATGEELKKINRRYHILLVFFVAVAILSTGFGFYLWLV